MLQQVDWTVSGLGGHVYALSVKASESPRRLAIGCGDGTIRLAPLCNDTPGAQPQDSTLIWQVSISTHCSYLVSTTQSVSQGL